MEEVDSDVICRRFKFQILTFNWILERNDELPLRPPDLRQVVRLVQKR